MSEPLICPTLADIEEGGAYELIEGQYVRVQVPTAPAPPPAPPEAP